MNVQKPVAAATAPQYLIPTEPYLSADYARAERDLLWRKVWQVACREEELPEVGNYVTYEILDDSIIVIRTADGAIKAHHNACRHRGRRLVDGCGSARRLACRFHGWEWDIDGNNTRVVRESGYAGRLGAEELRLGPVRVGTWGGWVFVNLDPDCEPLEDYLAEVKTLLDPFELDRMRYRWRQWLHFPCNWKVAIEAFNEGYHVLGTHPQLAVFSDKPTWSKARGLHGQFGPEGGEGIGGGTGGAAGAPDMRIGLAVSLNKVWEEVWATTTQTMVDVANRLIDELPEGTDSPAVFAHFMTRVIEEDAKRGVAWPKLDPAAVAASGADWHIFPNTVIIHGPTFALCYRARPNGYDPDSCIFEVYTLERYPEGGEPKPENQHCPVIEEGPWPLVLTQDFSNMGEVQRGMKSMSFKGARPHPIEEVAVVNFHHALAQYMGQGGPELID